MGNVHGHDALVQQQHNNTTTPPSNNTNNNINNNNSSSTSNTNISTTPFTGTGYRLTDSKDNSNYSSSKSGTSTQTIMPKKSSSTAAAGGGSGSAVYLNVYEPGNGKSGSTILGLGVYHTGVELNGIEYLYAGGAGIAGCGISTQTPRETPSGSEWKYKETINLGTHNKSSREVEKILYDLRDEFPAAEYDLIHKNCNSFSQRLVESLGLKFPSHINRAAELGQKFMTNPNAAKQKARQMQQQEEKKTVFEKTKGYALTEEKTNNKKGGLFTTNNKTSTAAVGSGKESKNNPWRNPNFKTKAMKQSDTPQ